MSNKPTPLAAKLDQLGIGIEECAKIARLPLAEVEAMVNGDAPVPDVPFRWLADDADAARRVDQLRRTHTTTLEGDGARQAGVTVPYGTSDIGKKTGGVS
jgi:hypothetical protein